MQQQQRLPEKARTAAAAGRKAAALELPEPRTPEEAAGLQEAQAGTEEGPRAVRREDC